MKVALALLLALFLGNAAEGACPKLDEAGLAALSKSQDNEGKPIKVVFFASWCAACKEPLAAAKEPGTIVVGAFDTAERIDAVATALGLEGRCYRDDGLTKALGVTGLPATRLWPKPP